MANELLDFVMSLVRDPDAAAAYADNPSQAISDAHLTDVTSMDVNNLIPVVAESLSMAVPTTGSEHLAEDPSSNVWASGAATAAFDAFDDHLPAEALDQVHTVAANIVDDGAVLQPALDALSDADVPALAGVEDPSVQFDVPVIDDSLPIDGPADDGWGHPVVEDHHPEPDSSGFDIFD